MNFKSLLVLCVLITSLQESVYAMFRVAGEKDITALLALIKVAEADKDKIVILPEKFRQESIKKSLAQQRLFVAEKDNTLVGYKKLFEMADSEEKQQILEDELRIQQRACYSCFIDNAGQFLPSTVTLPSDAYDLCIYNGADFTAPRYRGQRINSDLTSAALESIKPNILARIAENRPRYVTMVYGITQENAGQQPGAYPDRTIGIVKQFRTFVESLPNTKTGEPIMHMRYEAAKPSFDLQATELKPLPDQEAVPGFGCVLSYPLGDTHA